MRRHQHRRQRSLLPFVARQRHDRHCCTVHSLVPSFLVPSLCWWLVVWRTPALTCVAEQRTRDSRPRPGLLCAHCLISYVGPQQHIA